ncbi:Imm1 family immunity protein [Saccharopolyspora sp. MS10]|uniref:Imm1 family immunity protein n=1 Tax=Saccharopolyspora sp. MS10 TaxID=3385973 RepID=UPI0039A395BC
MSNPSLQDGPVEPLAVVFARLADVPLDQLDKLIEVTNSAYGELNKIHGHPYWGELVLHQGAAAKALREARDCLDALRSEAVGARNTELGVTVATAVVDGQRHYATSSDDKAALVEKVLRPPNAGGAAHLYVWDRPYESDEIAGPYQQLRVVTDPEAEVGVLNYTEESEDGELTSWHTCNPRPLPAPPKLRFDLGSALLFPRDSVLPFRELRAGLLEHVVEGARPGAVQWQQARWGEH